MKQTEELFKNGKVTSDGGRGKMFANGSAYADGSHDGEAFAWGASASPSKFATTKIKDDGGTPKVKAETKTKVTKKNDGVEVNNEINLQPNISAKASDKSNSLNEVTEKEEEKAKNENKFEEAIDWIEIILDRAERAIDKYEQQSNNVYKTWAKRNKALENEINQVSSTISLYEKAKNQYLSEANSVGLSESYASKVRNGSLSVEDFQGENDEKLVKKIKNYQDLYDKYLNCVDKINELKEQEASLYSQRFENVQSEYDNLLQGFDHTESMLNEYISQAEEKGYIVSKNYYGALIDNEEDRISTLKQEQSALIKARDEAVANGEFDKYSEEW